MHFEHYSNNVQDLQDEEVEGYRRSATNLRALIITQGQNVSGVQRNTITPELELEITLNKMCFVSKAVLSMAP